MAFIKPIITAAAALMLCASGYTAENGLPKGWISAGSKPASYTVSKDTPHDGHNTLKYQSIKNVEDGFGTIMQTIKADKFKGKRVRLSGYIKSEKLSDWAGLWMRVDGEKKGEMLAFDNMQDRAVRGTTDWKKYEVVLDVPAKDSSQIAFGFLLGDNGTIWVSGLQFEIVNNTVAVTSSKEMTPDEPVNLDFK